MKTLNLVVAIIFTVLLTFTMLTCEGDSDTILGLMMLSVPVAVNWITYSKLK